MTDLEFREWLQAEVQNGRMTLRQHDDLLEQKQHFDEDRLEIKQQFPHRVVGYVNGVRKVGGSLQGLLAEALQSCPNRMVYFEPLLLPPKAAGFSSRQV